MTIAPNLWLREHSSGSFGQVPLFSLVTLVKKPNTSLSEKTVLSLSYGRVIVKDVTKNEGLLPASFESYNVVEPGDIVLRFTDMQNDKRSLRSGLVTCRGIITSAYLTLRPNPSVNPQFLASHFHALDVSKTLYALGSGVRQSLGFADISNIQVPLPPLDVQRRVVDMLDVETSRIDTLITKNQRILELLKLRQAAIVTQAVQSSPEVRPVPLRFAFQEVDERGGGRSHLLPLLSVSVENGVVLRNLKDGHQAPSQDVSHYKVCRIDDIAINTLRAFQGGLGVSDREGMVSPAYAVLRFNNKSHPRYIHHLMRSHWFIGQLAARVRGVGGIDTHNVRTPHINVSDIGRIEVPLPSLSIQQEIAKAIDRKIEKVERLKASIVRQNELLRLRRQALITAAVTGQIDV